MCSVCTYDMHMFQGVYVSCAFLCANAHIHMCICMWRSEVNVLSLATMYCGTGTLTGPRAAGSMLWAASSKDLPVSPPGARIIGMCFHALHFMWVLDVQTRVPMISLMRNALYQPSSLTAPSRIFNPSSPATCQVFLFVFYNSSLFLSLFSFFSPPWKRVNE